MITCTPLPLSAAEELSPRRVGVRRVQGRASGQFVRTMFTRGAWPLELDRFVGYFSELLFQGFRDRSVTDPLAMGRFIVVLAPPTKRT